LAAAAALLATSVSAAAALLLTFFASAEEQGLADAARHVIVIGTHLEIWFVELNSIYYDAASDI
jgi:hypothetical protein